MPWLSEEAAINACTAAEIALVKAHLTMRGALSEERIEQLNRAASRVKPAEVYKEEEKTQHNMRALVNVLKRELPAELSALVHLGATSVDILDTAHSVRIQAVTRQVLAPLLKELELCLCDLAEREAATMQVGRTHGQHAVPISFGFALAEYVSRLGKSILEIEERAGQLKGKLAGATGSYNATALLVSEPEELERIYLEQLGLKPSEHATQLVEPEYLLRLLLELTAAFGIIANLADDLRSLQRTEIAEVQEGFAADHQVGSSTMPQKRNPWNCEHVKSLWKAFMPRAMSFFMDQISEHQRDLTNSASQRFIADFITGFCYAVSRMTAVIRGLLVNKERMYYNLYSSAGSIMAEPAYLALAESGLPDAHEQIRRLTVQAEKERMSFTEALMQKPELCKRIADFLYAKELIASPEDIASFFEHPERYSGHAVQKAQSIALKYRRLFQEEREKL